MKFRRSQPLFVQIHCKGRRLFFESSSGKTITLKVKASDRTEDAKAKLQETEVIHCHHQVASFDGEEIKDDREILCYNVKTELRSTLVCGILED
jgi:hypothetical protein